MRQVLRTLVLAVFIVLTVIPSFAQKTVWSGDDLKDQEIRSLNDIFEITTSWFNATNDDAAIQYSRNGLAGPGGAWWPVYLNGTKLDAGVWGTSSLQTIPVTISQIDSVVLIESPMLYEGEFTEKGGLFIYSKDMDEGIRVQADIKMGNRSGDPGPFVYTEKASRNVERVGPTVGAMVSYKKKDFGIQAGVKKYTLAVTDPIQLRRINPLEFGGEPMRHGKIRSNSFHLKGDVIKSVFTHQVQFGVTESTDFLFTELHGIEVPVDRNWVFASYDGSAEMAERLKLNYQLKRSSNKVEEYPNKDDKWLRWDQQVTGGKASLVQAFARGEQEMGVGFNLYELQNEVTSSSQLSTSTYRLFHRLKYSFLEPYVFTSNLTGITGSQGNVALKANARLNASFFKDHSFFLDLTYSERLPEEDNSLWFWTSEKGFAQDTLSEYRPAGLPDKIRFLQARVGWKTKFIENVDFESALAWSRNMDEYALHYVLVPNGNSILTGEYQFIDNLDADFLTVPLKFAATITPQLRQTVQYTWRYRLSGRENLFKMMPAHTANMQLNWKPVDSFKIWTRMRVQSKSTWASAESLEEMEVRINPNQTVTYTSSLSSRFQWDLGIEKHFWNERVTVNLDAINILDEEYRNSPLSPEHSFTIYFGLRLNLPE